jgi:hypothetical protein
MSEQFSRPDSFRFSQEREAAAVREAAEKLSRQAENLLTIKGLKLFGSFKVRATSTEGLVQVVGPNSTSKIFDGKLSITADVNDLSVTVDVPVEQSNMTLPEDKDLIDILNEATKGQQGNVTTDMASAIGEPLYASLDGFSLVDDGTEFLKIYNSISESQIGIVAKNEYSTIEDKEAFFKEVVSNAVNRSSLEFKGSFVEPSITRTASEVPAIEKTAAAEEVKCKGCGMVGSIMCDKCEAKEAALVAPEQLQAALPDSFRQATETEDYRVNAQREKLSNQVANDLIPHLRSLAYEDIKISEVDYTDLKDGENGLSGTVAVTATLIDGPALRRVTFPVHVENSSYSFGQKSITATRSLIASSVDIHAEVEAKLAEEALAKNAETDTLEQWKETETTAALDDVKVAPIVKVAMNGGGTQYVGPTDVIEMDKHLLGLPDDTEIGEEICADGFRWKLTSKSKSQLSAGQDDGSVWVFTKVAPSDAEPVAEVGI